MSVATVADGINLLSRPQVAAALREIHQKNAHFAPYVIAGMPIRIADLASFERELSRIAELPPGSMESRLLDTLDKCFSDGTNGRDIAWEFLSSLEDFSPGSVRHEFADRLLRSGQISHIPDDVLAEVTFSPQQLHAVEDTYVDGPPGPDFSCYITTVGKLASSKRPPTVRASLEIMRDVTPGFARCVRDLISDSVSETERSTLGLRRTGDAVVHELIEIARTFVTEVKSANISPENLAKVQSSEFLGQLLIIVTRYDSSDWGSRTLASLRELLRYHDRASAEGRIAPIPAEYQPSSVLEIAKLRSRDSGSGSQWTEDLLTRFERLAKNLLDARSALTSAHRPITYLVGKLGRGIVEHIEELDRCIASDTLADGSPMNDKARRNMVARVHELKELIASEAGGSQQFPALRSLENFENNFQRLVQVGKLHDDLRTICFAWAIQQHPVWIDRLKSLRPEEPTLEDVGLVRDFVDHTTNQEVFARYFSSRKSANKFRRMTSVMALEEAILRTQGVGVSSDSTPLQFVPTRGQLLELSGNIASACWAGRYPSVAEAMPNMTAVIMVRNPDDPARTAFAGASLLLETSSEAGEPLLLVRGLNPIENYINHVSVADFYRKFMDWAQEIATARGCRLAIVIDHKGGASTNRPVLFDHLTAERKKLKRIRIDSENTTFNGYDVADDTYLVEPPEPPSAKSATASIPIGEQPRSTGNRTDPVAIDLGDESSEGRDFVASEHTDTAADALPNTDASPRDRLDAPSHRSGSERPGDPEQFRRQVKQLVAQGNTEQAVAILRESFAHNVFRWIQANMRAPQAAREVFDEACAHAIRRIGQIGQREVGEWVVVNARNLMAQHREIAEIWYRIQDFVARGARWRESDPLAAVLAEADTVQVRQHMHALTPNQQQMLRRFASRPSDPGARSVLPGDPAAESLALWHAACALVAAVADAGGVQASLPDAPRPQRTKSGSSPAPAAPPQTEPTETTPAANSRAESAGRTAAPEGPPDAPSAAELVETLATSSIAPNLPQVVREALASDRQALQDCIEKLAPPQRQILHLRFGLGMSPDRTADTLDRTPAAVRTAQHATFARLAALLERRAGNEALAVVEEAQRDDPDAFNRCLAELGGKRGAVVRDRLVLGHANRELAEAHGKDHRNTFYRGIQRLSALLLGDAQARPGAKADRELVQKTTPEALILALPGLTNATHRQTLILRFVRRLPRAEAAEAAGVGSRAFEMRELRAVRTIAELLRTTTDAPATTAPPTAPQPRPLVLSDRETEILRMLLADMYFAEIAAALGITPAAVRTHAQHIYRKLRVGNRAQLAEAARSAGIDLPSPSAQP